ncbi:MAG: hypothetical protein HKN21_09685 [Candidatus Eisenbacteria bacterium]|uniref:Porin n=1 Tax=Eiseniibacteriota bacterium TaxID=2212470 RepID=A0A7Y2E879_UNCEI|nr:hypothetical protein [Candidatus Eisenbacteria bacterium]
MQSQAIRLAAFLFFVAFLFTTMITPPLFAQEDEEMGFDDVEEATVPETKGWEDIVHISGMFDLNLEMTNLHDSDDSDGEKLDNFRNYHHFVFLSVTPNEKVRFQADIIDLFFYEMTYKLNSKAEVKAGKIWVPFGNSPYHHFYGGVQGDPFTGKLVPNVWAEQGVGLSYEVARGGGGSTVLTGDTYIIRGFEGPAGSVLNLNEGGKDDVFAYGQRVMLNLGSNKAVASASGLYSPWGPDNDNRVFLWGGDLDLGYGVVDAPLLRDLAFRGAFARAEVKDPELVEEFQNEDGWYYKYGDFAELSYGHWRPNLTLKFRYGSYIDFDDVITNNDSHSFNISAVRRMGNISLWAQYFWLFEEVDEIDNDFMRLRMVFEF